MKVYRTNWQIKNNEPAQKSQGTTKLILHPEISHQTIEGFGGAFTRASALVLRTLPLPVQQEAMRLYFDPEYGAGYTLCRTPIGGCDFSDYAYTCDDVAGDKTLEHFSIEPDLDTTLPMIREARDMAGSDFRLYACPWSPPAWMKDTARLEFGGRLLKCDYPVMARYFIRFLDAYREQGVDIWGLTAQNEPNESLRWLTCLYSAQEEAEFLADYLLPALEKAGYGKIHVMLWDNNKDLIEERVRHSLEARPLEDRLWGVAFHCYGGDHFDQLMNIHQRYPSLHLLSTENCTPLVDSQTGRSPGERYAHEIIGDINNGACGFLDWNLFLNEDGGPSYAENACMAPLMAIRGRLVRTQAYDVMYFFSHFVRPGSRRIEMENTGTSLETVAFLTPENQAIMIAYNPTDSAADASVHSSTFIIPAHGLAVCVENICSDQLSR